MDLLSLIADFPPTDCCALEMDLAWLPFPPAKRPVPAADLFSCMSFYIL